jgi:hypothetical protein
MIGVIGDVKILQQKFVPADGHCCIERIVELNNRKEERTSNGRKQTTCFINDENEYYSTPPLTPYSLFQDSLILPES